MSAKYTVGQEVWVASNSAIQRDAPGQIIKVGRRYVTIWREIGRPDCRQYDMETGLMRDGFAKFYSMEEWARKQANDEALVYLASVGVALAYHSTLRKCAVELADMIKAIEAK